MSDIEIETRPLGEVKWEQYRRPVIIDGTGQDAPTLPEGTALIGHQALVSQDKGRLHPWMTPEGLKDPVTVSVSHGGVSGSVYHTKFEHGARHNWNEKREWDDEDDIQPSWRFVEREHAQTFGLHECKSCRRGVVARAASKDGVVVRSVGDGRVSLLVEGEIYSLGVGQVLKDGSVITLGDDICEDLGIERPSEGGEAVE